MKWLLILSVLLLSSCGLFDRKVDDPYDGVTWVMTQDKRLALCTPDKSRCFAPSKETWEWAIAKYNGRPNQEFQPD